MGYDIKEYEEAMKENEELKNMEVVACNPVASAVISFMQGRQNWEGTATELLPLLKSTAEVDGYPTRSGIWPQAPHSLVRRLNESMENLRKENLEIISSRSALKRVISIERIPLSDEGER